MMKDLVLLVADKDMQFALKGILSRPDALGIRPVSFDFRVHPQHDGGVRTTGVNVLAGEARRFKHALMLFDHEGCGHENEAPLDMEGRLDKQLEHHWQHRAKSIVIAPEVDVWLWGSDNVLSEVFSWPLEMAIRPWLTDKGFAFDERNKPVRPKEALEEMVRVHRQPRSSAVYEGITGKISLKNCVDLSFSRLRCQLQQWFSG